MFDNSGNMLLKQRQRVSEWISLDEHDSCWLFVCAAIQTDTQLKALVVFLTANLPRVYSKQSVSVDDPVLLNC